MHFVCDFTQKAVVAVYSTMLSLKVKPVEYAERPGVPSGTLKGMVGSVSFAGKITGYNGLLAPPLIMQGENIVVEPKDAPIIAYNRFSIPDLKEELTVRVYAKLDA